MSVYHYTLAPSDHPRLGLIVLQSDRTVEVDFRRLLPRNASLLVSRVPSGQDVTPETLADMEHNLAAAAGLFPQGLEFATIGYACTSGAAQIGPTRLADQIRQGTTIRNVTDPVTALVAVCRARGIARLAILSPYIPAVSAKLRDVLEDRGLTTPVFGTFAEAEEAKVAEIDPASTFAAATAMMDSAEADALFISCTNLRTLDVLSDLRRVLGLPVLSSNLVLAWHMLDQAGAVGAGSDPIDLLT